MNAARLSLNERLRWCGLEEGGTITDQAYWCTSESRKVAKGFAFGNYNQADAVPFIFVITHTSGRSIKKYVSERFKWEKEVLFPRNTVFRIDEVQVVDETSESGHTRFCHILHLSQVGEPMR